MKKKLLKKGDIILIISAVLISLLLFLCINFFNNKGELVQIEVNGAVQIILPLDENAVYEVKNNGKITNTVEIKDGFIFVSYADCKDQICVEHKKISKVNESIICLPNKVIVTVVSAEKDADSDIDGVV